MRDAIYTCPEHAMRRAFGEAIPHYGSTLTVGRGSGSGLCALDHIAQDAMTRQIILRSLPEWAASLVAVRYVSGLDLSDAAAEVAAGWMLRRQTVDACDSGYLAWCIQTWAERPRRRIGPGEWAERAGITPWKQRQILREVKRACADEWARFVLPRVGGVLADAGLL